MVIFWSLKKFLALLPGINLVPSSSVENLGDLHILVLTSFDIGGWLMGFLFLSDFCESRLMLRLYECGSVIFQFLFSYCMLDSEVET